MLLSKEDPISRTAVAIRHVGFEDLGLLKPILDARGYDVTYVEAGVRPMEADSLLAPDLVVVLGGPISVNDTATYPFLANERDAIRERLVINRPTLGVCLGAQLIASALDAPVRASTKAEIGYATIDLTPEGVGSALGPLEGVRVFHWHGEEFELPPGATSLASTHTTVHQAFLIGDRVLGIQFHLEADHSQIERWLIGHTHELAARGIDPNTIREEATTFGPALATAATRVLTSWLDRAEASVNATGERPKQP